MSETYSYLQFIPYASTQNWSVQYMRGDNALLSAFPIKLLGNFINEENKKYNISDPSKEYGILGVNNQAGIFDAYRENGAKIKQKYKLMKEGWIAYNPYRVNVGSVGVKRQSHRNDYISPAYVVFSCKEGLLPDFLYLIMKTPTFNSIIRKNTTGSVRQSLSFKNLKDLKIPLPSLEEQERLVEQYQMKIRFATEKEGRIEEQEAEIDKFFQQKVGLVVNDTASKYVEGCRYLQLVHLKDIKRWDCYHAISTSQSSNYKSVCLSDIVKVPPMYGAAYKANDEFTGIRYIRITDINDDGSLNEEAISAREYSDLYLLRQNDFLIARSGNTVGKTFLYEEQYGKAIFAGYLIKFTLNEDLVNPYYLLYYTKTSIYKRWISENMRVSAQPNINSQQYMNSPIILPSMAVQADIVSHVKETKIRIQELRREAQRLRKQALEDFEKELFK